MSRSIKRSLGTLLAALLSGACSSGAPGGATNIVLLTLDTTRADRLGCYGYRAAHTPALDGLAASGVTFDQAFTTAPMTLPAHATILTGLHPPEHGLRVNGAARLDLDQPTLTELLKGRGYQTGAFIASFSLAARNGLNVGFEVYDDDLSAAYPGQRADSLAVHRSGELVVDSALAWLRTRETGRPFFVWIHLFDPHLPYMQHASLAETHFAGRASYDSEIAFMDQQVSRVLSFLRKNRLGARSLVIAVGDHGEGLGQHGEPDHGYLLYEETLRVPLIMSQPGRIPPGRRISSVVSLVDLFGTVLEWIDAEPEPRSGRSLAPALSGSPIPSRAAYSETDLPYTSFQWSPLRSLTTPEWKYIRTARRRLFDRQRDPAELEDIIDQGRAESERLEHELRSIESAMRRSQPGRSRGHAEDRARLQALGYVDGGVKPPPEDEIDYESLRDVEDALDVAARYWPMLELGRSGRSQEQMIVLREMLAASPESVLLRRLLGAALLETGQLDAALVELERVVEEQPENALAHRNLGEIHGSQGHIARAEHHFAESVRLDPGDADAHKGLAVQLARKGDAGDALHHFGESLKLDDTDPQVWLLAGSLLESRGDLPGSIEHYRRALALAPYQKQAANNLAWILATAGSVDLRDGPEAVRLALLAADGGESDSPDLLDTLAAAYAEAGRFDEALTSARRALVLANAAERAELAAALESRIARYASGAPYPVESR